MPRGFRKNGTKLGFQKGHKKPKGFNIGRKIIWKDKISQALKGRSFGHKFPKGHIGFHTPESKEKVRQKLKGRKITWAKKIGDAQRGEKGNNWQGGISFEPYSINWTDDLRESIRKRDNYICQMCGIHQDELNRKLQCHHKDYDKDNLNPDNLISLCNACHQKTNFNRNYWISYFK